MTKLFIISIALAVLLISNIRAAPLEERIGDDLISAETYAFGYFSNPYIYSSNAMGGRVGNIASNSRNQYFNEAIVYVPDELSFIAAVIPVAAASTPTIGSNGFSDNHMIGNQIPAAMPLPPEGARSYFGSRDYGRTASKYDNRQAYSNGNGNGVGRGDGWNYARNGLNTDQYYRKTGFNGMNMRG